MADKQYALKMLWEASDSVRGIVRDEKLTALGNIARTRCGQNIVRGQLTGRYRIVDDAEAHDWFFSPEVAESPSTTNDWTYGEYFELDPPISTATDNRERDLRKMVAESKNAIIPSRVQSTHRRSGGND